MYVNKYKLIKPSLDAQGTYINLPISNLPGLAGQSEIVDTKFVDVEVEKSINEIIDYESAKFTPINTNGSDVSKVTYIINLYDDNQDYIVNTKWSDAGFTADDILNQKNVFTNSFVRLDFYDTDENSKQRLLFFVTLYPKINVSNFGVNPENAPLQFELGNTLINPEMNGEGFFLYYFKDEVLPTVGKPVYMRATFLNAKTGQAKNFMSTDQLLPINDLISPIGLVNNLYTNYALFRYADGYKYGISNIYSTNVEYKNGGNDVEVNLYQIKVA